MTDVLTKEQRRYNMSMIRGRWTKQEKLIHSYLKGRKIKHVMHPKMYGNPDIFLIKKNTVVFLDGCFWHGCPYCYRRPTSNIKYWTQKIKRNKEKDIFNTKLLRRNKIKVIRLWECQLKKDFEKYTGKLLL